MQRELKYTDSSSKCLVSKDSGTNFIDFHVEGIDGIYIRKAHIYCLLVYTGHLGFREWAQDEVQLNSLY